MLDAKQLWNDGTEEIASCRRCAADHNDLNDATEQVQAGKAALDNADDDECNYREQNRRKGSSDWQEKIRGEGKIEPTIYEAPMVSASGTLTVAVSPTAILAPDSFPKE
jgi:hypothetical protein